MAVVLETTLGDLTIDLFTSARPRTCQNFLKLCKMKYYNLNLFHTVRQNFIAQTGDPTGEGSNGSSVFGLAYGDHKRYYEAETTPKILHTKPGLVSMVNCGKNLLGSQFFITLGPDLHSLNEHCVFGEVVEGFDVLLRLNNAICNEAHRPYQDIRVTHTVVLEDPCPDVAGLRYPASPRPSRELLANGLIGADEDIDETRGMAAQEVEELRAAREAKARATILEIVGDLPEADAAPPENVLFVCKLNPVTSDEDLEIIFARFGKINCCEVIRDKVTGDSLQYAFIEFDNPRSCEEAYLKMDNVLIDDRRIHVDFSQSVSKLKWKGRGRGVEHVGEGSRYERYRERKEDRRGERGEKQERKENGERSYERQRRDGERGREDRERDGRYREERASDRDRDRPLREKEKDSRYRENIEKLNTRRRERDRYERDTWRREDRNEREERDTKRSSRHEIEQDRKDRRRHQSSSDEGSPSKYSKRSDDSSRHPQPARESVKPSSSPRDETRRPDRGASVRSQTSREVAIKSLVDFQNGDPASTSTSGSLERKERLDDASSRRDGSWERKATKPHELGRSDNRDQPNNAARESGKWAVHMNGGGRTDRNERSDTPRNERNETERSGGEKREDPRSLWGAESDRSVSRDQSERADKYRTESSVDRSRDDKDRRRELESEDQTKRRDELRENETPQPDRRDEMNGDISKHASGSNSTDVVKRKSVETDTHRGRKSASAMRENESDQKKDGHDSKEHNGTRRSEKKVRKKRSKSTKSRKRKRSTSSDSSSESSSDSSSDSSTNVTKKKYYRRGKLVKIIKTKHKRDTSSSSSSSDSSSSSSSSDSSSGTKPSSKKTKKENIKKDVSKKENIKKDVPRKENIKKDSSKKENLKKESSKKENAKKESSKGSSSRKKSRGKIVKVIEIKKKGKRRSSSSSSSSSSSDSSSDSGDERARRGKRKVK